jgi:broad specificity phosphatase PhoE
MRVIVVRHYKTLGNANNQILGWGDAPRVPDWAADLDYVDARLQACNVQVDAVYSSFLERARQTAMFYARRRGILLVHDVWALNEINYGILYRKDKDWVHQNIPQHKTDPDFVYPEGESFRQMQQRSVGFLLSLERRFAEQTLLVVVHAGVIRGFVCRLLGLDYAANLKQKVTHRYIGDFRIEGGCCLAYDELGEASGFVRSEAIKVPYQATRSLGELSPQADVAIPGLTSGRPMGDLG